MKKRHKSIHYNNSDLDGYYGCQDKVFYVIDERLGDGAEGIVFSCYQMGNKQHKYAAKIYHKENQERISKLIWLITQYKNGRFKGLANVVFPKQLLSSSSKGEGHIVGFLMEFVPGFDLRATIGRTNWVLNHWTRKELVQFCLALLKTFTRLHEVGILMADINPSNIRVDEKEHKPRFIDTDSYQITIEGDLEPTYVCKGYTVDFSTPKFLHLLAENTNGEIDFRRDLSAEYHAITVLLFMVLMIGRNPYSKAGRSELKKQIVDKVFQFPLETNFHQAFQPTMRIWYSMTPEMRTAFHNTFAKEKPISPKEWIDILRDYLEKMRIGYYTNQIFPVGNGSIDSDNRLFGLDPQPFSVDSPFYKELHQFVYQPKRVSRCCSVVEIGGDSIRMITCDDPVDVVSTQRFSIQHLFVSEKTGLKICSRMNTEGKIDPIVTKNVISSAIDVVWEDMMGNNKIYPGRVFSYGTHWLRLATNRRTIIQHLRRETDLIIGLTEEQEECRFSAQGAYLNLLSSGLSEQDFPLISLELTPTCFRIVSRTPDGRFDYLSETLGLQTLKHLLRPEGKCETIIVFDRINEIIESRIQYLPIAEWMSRNGLEDNNFWPVVTGDSWKNVLQGLSLDNNLSFGHCISISVSDLSKLLIQHKNYLSQYHTIDQLYEYTCKEDSYGHISLEAILTLSLYIPILKRLGLGKVYVFGRSTAYGALYYHCFTK